MLSQFLVYGNERELLSDWEGWSQRPLLFLWSLISNTHAEIPYPFIVLKGKPLEGFLQKLFLPWHYSLWLHFLDIAFAEIIEEKCRNRNIIDCPCSTLKKLQMANFSRIQKKIISNDVLVSKSTFYLH